MNWTGIPGWQHYPCSSACQNSPKSIQEIWISWQSSSVPAKEWWRTFGEAVKPSITGVLHKEGAETKRHNCQPPRKWDPEAVQVALKELPWNQRKNVRSAASKLGIHHSTLQYMKKTLVIQRKRSSLKLHLTEENKQRKQDVESCTRTLQTKQ